MKPMRCRLIESLESSPMTTRQIAECLGTTIATVRTRLADFRSVGAVRVVSTKPQGAYTLQVWGIAQRPQP